MPPNKILIDTNLWLDLASDPSLTPLLTAIRELVRDQVVELLVPQLVLDEFARNRDRVAEQKRRSLSTHLRRVREAVGHLVDDDAKPEAVAQLDELQLKVATKGGVAHHIIETVEKLMATKSPMVASDSAKIKAVERALAKLAPFHLAKNSAVDALLIEMFAEAVEADSQQQVHYFFVTRNTRDFSQQDGDNRLPHPDFAHVFAPDNCHYSTSTADVVRAIDPDLLAEFEYEFSYHPEPRELAELLNAEHLLFKQIWYNRHRFFRAQVESGEIKVVPRDQHADTGQYRSDIVLSDVWEAALAAASATEKEVGQDRLGPWSDFEWGMLNGKLSALRWVLGDDWDMLDT